MDMDDVLRHDMSSDPMGVALVVSRFGTPKRKPRPGRPRFWVGRRVCITLAGNRSPGRVGSIPAFPLTERERAEPRGFRQVPVAPE